MRKQYKVTTSKEPLNLRKSPSYSSSAVSQLARGSTFVSIAIKNQSDGSMWHQEEKTKMWCCGKTSGGLVYTTFVKNLDNDGEFKPVVNHSHGYSDGLDNKVIEMLYKSPGNSDNLDVSTRLFGAPYQFLPSTDFRVNTKIDMGRKFIENIVSESPIVNFLPGKPNFMPNTTDERKGLIAKVLDFAEDKSGEAGDAIKDILGQFGNEETKKKAGEERYFDFVSDYATYIRYVNTLCRMAAIYLEIGDRYVPWSPTTKYKYYNWENYKYFNLVKEKDTTNKSVFTMASNKLAIDIDEIIFGKGQYIPFYVDVSTSFSESANNSTQASKLEGFFDQAENISKEAAFFMGASALSKDNSFITEVSDLVGDLKDKMFSSGADSFFTRILSSTRDTLVGGNLIFPEIWGDTTYNKSYSVTLNLATPYGDKESIYNNIFVPMMFALALTLPHQISSNAYASPFLVKAFSKGWFSCDMGIIDSINIEKGGAGEAWSVDGLPLQVKITMSIKDLYSNLMITDSKNPSLFMNNQGLMDFLAVTCGLDITEPTFMIKIKTLWAIFANRGLDIPNNIYNGILEDLREILRPITHMDT